MKKRLYMIVVANMLMIMSFAQSFDKVLFTGRFDFSNSTKVVFSHVGSSLKANFNGTGISVKVASASTGASATSYMYVIIDGNVSPENRKLITISGTKVKTISLASGLPAGNHTVELVKETEYDSKVAFYGFTVTGGTLLDKPVNPATLSIEFYGDSNPAGYDAYDPADAGNVIDNGGYYIYPAITARMLNADYHNISMGGVGITDKAWRNLTNFYHLIHMNDAASGTNLWNFNNYSPDVIVINCSSNDHSSGATKAEVKAGWKSFLQAVRTHHPAVHVVFAESFGWAYNEPTDYLSEAIDEMKASGIQNISFVKFPWLWGQNHAVINEHAGFANILASHIAQVMNLPTPVLSNLSSFAPYGTVTNGSFEKSSIPGVADGWRPNGSVTLIKDATKAKLGINYLQLYNQAWVNFANSAKAGDEFVVTGWMRGAQNGDLGKLKLEFKDQAQNTIATNEGLVSLTTNWQKVTTTAIAPAGTWAVWVVLVAESRDYVLFDDINMTLGNTVKSVESNSQLMNYTDEIKTMEPMVYPNPVTNGFINITGLLNEQTSIKIYDITGKIVKSVEANQPEIKINFGSNLLPGVYTIAFSSSNSNQWLKFIIR